MLLSLPDEPIRERRKAREQVDLKEQSPRVLARVACVLCVQRVRVQISGFTGTCSQCRLDGKHLEVGSEFWRACFHAPRGLLCSNVQNDYIDQVIHCRLLYMHQTGRRVQNYLNSIKEQNNNTE